MAQVKGSLARDVEESSFRPNLLVRRKSLLSVSDSLDEKKERDGAS
jgi:hypothetical protein